MAGDHMVLPLLMLLRVAGSEICSPVAQSMLVQRLSTVIMSRRFRFENLREEVNSTLLAL
jgi:hypothetical protein